MIYSQSTDLRTSQRDNNIIKCHLQSNINIETSESHKCRTDGHSPIKLAIVSSSQSQCGHTAVLESDI